MIEWATVRITLCLVVLYAALAVTTACTRDTAKQGLRRITIVGPLTTFMWPAYIADQGGYYRKYGLDVRLVFANHPADVAMLTSGEADVNMNTLDHGMQLTARQRSFKLFGSPLRKWLFALIGRRDLHGVEDLKGKRIGITQLGGSTHNYAAQILAFSGVAPDKVQWVSLGSNSRAAALISGRVDATMLSAPSYFPLQEDGFTELANIKNIDRIHTTNVFIIKNETLTRIPNLPELLIQAQAEAVKRYYDDAPFAIQSYLAYDKMGAEGLQQVYDKYASDSSFDKVPYISSPAVSYVIENNVDAAVRNQMKTTDYSQIIDNRTVDRLASRHFFEEIFGISVRNQQAEGAVAAFR